jgi:hypothetical protein
MLCPTFHFTFSNFDDNVHDKKLYQFHINFSSLVSISNNSAHDNPFKHELFHTLVLEKQFNSVSDVYSTIKKIFFRFFLELFVEDAPANVCWASWNGKKRRSF